MKKLLYGMMLLGIASYVCASVSIEFSPGTGKMVDESAGGTPGGWVYTGATKVFSFTQIIDIDAVLGDTTDALYNQRVYLPNLKLTSYAGGIGTVESQGDVQIQDAYGNILLTGTLGGGNLYAINTTSVIYPEITMDIQVTQVDHAFGSAFLNTVSIGMYFDLSLSLNTNLNFNDVFQNNWNDSDGFSGSMNLIPEPATLVLLGLGGLFCRKIKRA